VIDISNCSPDGSGNIYVTPGVPFSCTLKVTNGAPPFNWNISSGDLPQGFTLDPNTGVISGTWTLPLPPSGLTAIPVKKNKKKKPERVLLIRLTK
jgi:hypothetical protein